MNLIEIQKLRGTDLQVVPTLTRPCVVLAAQCEGPFTTLDTKLRAVWRHWQAAVKELTAELHKQTATTDVTAAEIPATICAVCSGVENFKNIYFAISDAVFFSESASLCNLKMQTHDLWEYDTLCKLKCFLLRYAGHRFLG